MEHIRTKRTVMLFWIFVGCFSMLFARLYFLQLSEGNDLAQRAYIQQNQVVSLEERPRGDILDRNRVPFTGTRVENRVVVFPHLVENKTLVAFKLGDLLQLPYQQFLRQLEGKPFVISQELSAGQVDMIQTENMSGVFIFPFERRYEKSPLAVHLIGHLGKVSATELREYQGLTTDGLDKKTYGSNDVVGKMGLEKYYEPYLKGGQYEKFVAAPTDAKNRPLKGMGIIQGGNKDVNRNHIVLTIDKVMQALVERTLDENGVVNGAAVVISVETGDILAMASRPSFNPNDIGAALAQPGNNIFLDNSIQLVQPGSVFKPIVAAAAVELGLVQPESRFLCIGAGDELVSCYRDEGHGLIDFGEAMAYSCNPVFARVGQRVGADNIIDFATRLGLADQGIIGYPLYHSDRQNLNKIKDSYALVNSSIGQGPVLATPVQVTAMMATFARGGVYKKPRLVKELLDENYKETKVLAADEGQRAISEETCKALQQMFEGVTSYGTGQKANVPGWGSAGKTGSAEIDKSHGVVDAWFTGYAPLREPRYAVTVIVKDGESGGKNAAPIFKDIIQRILELN